MSNDVPQTLFLAVPGTEATRELDLESVRSAVARGEITLDNWAWSPARNEWVPLSQLPEFAAPVPAPVQVPVPMRIVKVEPKAVATPVAVKAVATPARAAVAAGAPLTQPAATGRKGHAATYYSKPLQEHHEFPIFKVLFVVLGLIIAALVGVNYFMVDQPFRANLAKTSFSKTEMHAHLAAFVQPSVLLIHVRPSKEITQDNFADLLTALTQSAPRQALAGHPFSTISLTPAWFGQYVIPAEDWDGFADMSGFSPEAKREYVMSHLETIGGVPVFETLKNETPEASKARQDKAWASLVAHFQVP